MVTLTSHEDQPNAQYFPAKKIQEPTTIPLEVVVVKEQANQLFCEQAILLRRRDLITVAQRLELLSLLLELLHFFGTEISLCSSHCTTIWIKAYYFCTIHLKPATSQPLFHLVVRMHISTHSGWFLNIVQCDRGYESCPFGFTETPLRDTYRGDREEGTRYSYSRASRTV